jgi:O-antigen/teichoic acid export membrane protein
MRLSNIAWNLTGLGTPLLVAIFTVPPLIQTIGMERFGLLSLAWGLIGYAGVFDLGIGRATTQFISQLRGQNTVGEIPIVIQAATRLTLLTGTIGFLLLTLAAILGAQKLIQHSVGLERELTISVFILAVAVPVQAISATYRGVNEAFENFRGISLLRMVLGVLNFLGPYLIAQHSINLAWLVSTLLVSRLLALTVFRYLAMRCVRKNIRKQPNSTSSMDKAQIRKRLFAFGGWFTLSSVISPLLVQSDRFVIAGVISATAVATYTIPYEVVVQSLIIVGAVSSVAFPSLTKLIHEKPGQWHVMFRRWLMIVASIMLTVTTTLALLLPIILPLWIGKGLPKESVMIGQILCIGVFANSIGAMYFALLHAKGRSDITAKLHLLEFPLFIAALYTLIGEYGIYGAALAWVGRMIFDTTFLKILSRDKYA